MKNSPLQPGTPLTSENSAAPAPFVFWYTVGSVLVLSILAVMTRLPAWDPPTLFLDDLWQGILSRLPFATQWEYRSSSPFGFTALQSLILSLFQDPEKGVQAIPFFGGIATIPLAAWGAWLVTRQPWAAVFAASLLAASPSLAAFSMRGKHYSIDALSVALLLILMVRTNLAKQGLSSFSVVAICVLPFSFASSIVSTLFVNSFILFRLLQYGTWTNRKKELATWAGFHLALALFYLLVLNRQRNPALVLYWSDHFPHSLAQMGSGFETLLQGVIPGALRTPSPKLYLLLGVGILLMATALISLLRTRTHRAMGLALFLVYPAVGTMAALRLYPLGGLRTDIFTYPVTALLLATGLAQLTRSLMRNRAATLAGLGTCLILGILAIRPEFLGMEIRYPRNPSGQNLVSIIEQTFQPGDTLIVQPHKTFLLCYYTTWPIKIQPCDFYATTFNPVVNMEGVHTLSGFIDYQADPTLLDPELDLILGRQHRRVFLFAENNKAGLHIRRRLQTAGYQGQPLAADESGKVVLGVFRPTKEGTHATP